MASLPPKHVFSGVVHPERKTYFREDAPPKSTVKEGKKDVIRGCTNCGKPGKNDNPVKKCAGCGLTYYCSQECQKEHWPIHKPNCSTEYGDGIQPLIKCVTGNPMLSHYIQVCLALTFSLHRLHALPAAQRSTVRRAALAAHIDVGIEPSAIGEFMRLYTYPEERDPELDADGVATEGMLQFHNLSRSDAWVPARPLSPTDIAMWRQAREDADADGERDNAVVLVRFVNNFKQMITCLFVVGDEALGQARRNMPFTMVSAITGKKTDKPLSVATCFEYLNSHIRADKKNQLLLRAPMRECDKELIRDAGRNKDGHAPKMLLLKMSREAVYVSYSKEFVDEAAAERLAAEEARKNPLPESRQIEGQAEEERERDEEARQAQEVPKPMNRADRRRLEREMKKEAKRRK
ncbi:hypothetical protein BJ912DRAFT_1147013 [Pholiota molesta]|nr:hypothetical protein BJ912DRAFT_1147013 [Pholiota molesta]